jgi:hypothetical protein
MYFFEERKKKKKNKQKNRGIHTKNVQTKKNRKREGGGIYILKIY